MSETERAKTEAAVLSANAEFYSAFSAGNHVAMRKLWAARRPIVCVHPGAPPLIGRDAVLDSWHEILREVPPFALRCDQPVARVLGDMAIVTCYEAGGEQPAHLVATNVFAWEEGAWRMVHHHAGPLSSPVPKAPSSMLN